MATAVAFQWTDPECLTTRPHNLYIPYKLGLNSNGDGEAHRLVWLFPESLIWVIGRVMMRD
jgi:hypothetical protein